jgi:NAD+ diphosphatase
MLPRPSRPNPLTGSPIDRASALRGNADWVAARLDDPDSLFLPVWRSESLLTEGASGTPEMLALSGADAAALVEDRPWAFLGLWNSRATFTVDLAASADPLALVDMPGARFADLRGVAATLPPAEAAILAHARGLLHWRARHGFCGVCGAATAPAEAGNRVVCTNCGTEHFPRTDPAVIMLVMQGDAVLLGHSRRFPNTSMFSTLAGFVEPGENLEEAVVREVFEEAGLRVTAAHYHSSQPWPFPASLMVGFWAETNDRTLKLDDDEILEARWFTRAELREPAAHGFTLPGPISIARRLVEDWIDAA